MSKTATQKATVIVEEVELDSCPFCGGKAFLKNYTSLVGGTSWYWGKCSTKTCGVSTKAGEDAHKSTDLWNRRA